MSTMQEVLEMDQDAQQKRHFERMASLGRCTGKASEVDATIVAETEKAIQIEYLDGVIGTPKSQWLPKKVCGYIELGYQYYPVLTVKNWFLSKESLWHLTK